MNKITNTLLLILLAIPVVSVSQNISTSSESVFYGQNSRYSIDSLSERYSDVIFFMLNADFNERQGDSKKAMNSLFQASLLSEDFKIAQQASYYALKKEYYEQAESASLRWLQIESAAPMSTNPRVTLSLAYVGMKRYDDAIRQMTLALLDAEAVKKYDKKYQGLYQRLAFFNYGKGLLDIKGVDAIKRYDDFLKAVAEDGLEITSYAYEVRAFIASQTNQMKLFENSLLAALDLDRHNLRAATRLMTFYVDSRYENVNHVIRVARQFLRDNNHQHAFRLVYANYLLFARLLNESQKQLSIVSGIRNNDELKSRAILFSGIQYYITQDYEKARDKVNQYLSFMTDNDEAWFALCDSEYHLKQYQAAIDACSQVTGEHYYFQSQLKIVEVMTDRKQFTEAISFLSELILDNVDEREIVTLRMVDIYNKLGQVDNAKTTLDAALTLDPNSAMLLYRRGLLSSVHGSMSEMEADFNKVAELLPDFADVYNSWGYTLAERTSRYDDALELVIKANELMPNDPYILDSVGWVYFKKQQYEKALYFLDQAHRIIVDPVIISHLIEVNWMIGHDESLKKPHRKESAVTLFKDALKWFSEEGDDEAIEAIKKTANRIGLISS